MMDPERNRRLIERFWSAIHANDFRAAGDCLHDDYVLDWPQSGERIRGRENFIAVNEHYPAAGPWRVTIHRIVADEAYAASEVTVTDGEVTAVAVTFSELRDGLIAAQTEYWPDPFEPAAWRAAWVERVG